MLLMCERLKEVAEVAEEDAESSANVCSSCRVIDPPSIRSPSVSEPVLFM